MLNFPNFLMSKFNLVRTGQSPIQLIQIIIVFIPSCRTGASEEMGLFYSCKPEIRFLDTFLCLVFIFTARVAKRAKVMFSQVCVTSTPEGGGGQHLPPPDNTSPLGQHLPAPPPPGPGHNTSPPPQLGSKVTTQQHLPPGLCAGGRYASYWNAFLSYVFPSLSCIV